MIQITYNPDTHVLVPMTPTEKMLAAARNAPVPAVHMDSISGMANLRATTAYKAMLYAAPELPAGQQDGCELDRQYPESRLRSEGTRAVGQETVIETVTGRYPATPPVVQPDRVPLPTNADQAAAMVRLGTMWLEQNAPDRLKKPQPQQGVLAAWARFSEPGDSEWAKGYDAARSYVRMQLAATSPAVDAATKGARHG